MKSKITSFTFSVIFLGLLISGSSANAAQCRTKSKDQFNGKEWTCTDDRPWAITFRDDNGVDQIILCVESRSVGDQSIIVGLVPNCTTN